MLINIQKSIMLFIFITLMSCTQDDSSDITVNETIDTTFVEIHDGLQVSGIALFVTEWGSIGYSVVDS